MTLTESLLTLKTIRIEEIFTLLVTLDSTLSTPHSLAVENISSERQGKMKIFHKGFKNVQFRVILFDHRFPADLSGDAPEKSLALVAVCWGGG